MHFLNEYGRFVFALIILNQDSICTLLLLLTFYTYPCLISFYCRVPHFVLSMPEDNTIIESPRRRHGLLRDQVQLVKRKDSDRYEIVPIQDPLSFEKGFFIVIRACQLLAQKNDGIILVGVAGPSGAGKTVFTEKVLNFMPSIAVISMDNYNDSSRIVDGNFDGNLYYEEINIFGSFCNFCHPHAHFQLPVKIIAFSCFNITMFYILF